MWLENKEVCVVVSVTKFLEFSSLHAEEFFVRVTEKRPLPRKVNHAKNARASSGSVAYIQYVVGDTSSTYVIEFPVSKTCTYSWAIGPENYSISKKVDTTPTKLHTYLTYVLFVPCIAGRAALTAGVDLCVAVSLI